MAPSQVSRRRTVGDHARPVSRAIANAPIDDEPESEDEPAPSPSPRLGWPASRPDHLPRQDDAEFGLAADDQELTGTAMKLIDLDAPARADVRRIDRTTAMRILTTSTASPRPARATSRSCRRLRRTPLRVGDYRVRFTEEPRDTSSSTPSPPLRSLPLVPARRSGGDGA